MSKFFGYSEIQSDFFTREGELMKLKSNYPLAWSYDDIPWVFFLKSGIAKACLSTEDSRESLLGFFLPGVSFAQSGSFFSMKTMHLTYETMTPCEVYRVKQEDFWNQIKKDPKFCEDYLKLILKYNLLLIDRIGYQNEWGLKNKIIMWLRFMAKYYGDLEGNKCTIDIPLTQEVIAKFNHCSRESVSIAFSELQANDLISVKQKRITINDMESFEKL